MLQPPLPCGVPPGPRHTAVQGHLLNFPSADVGGHMFRWCLPPRVPFKSLQIDEQLVQSSGKFLILDRMLPALKRRGHKVTARQKSIIIIIILPVDDERLTCDLIVVL